MIGICEAFRYKAFMSVNAAQALSATTPLEDLSALLKADMEQVNALIYKRMNSDVALIPQLAGYLIASGGKRLRPLLTLASARLFSADEERPFALAAAVEFIHTATLLHDDVVDESDQRRGKASANRVFGNQETVLVGDFLFSRAFELMVEDGSLDVLRILSKASAVIAEGEVLQLSIQGNLDTTLDQYKKVIGAKTAALFAAATEIGPIVTGQSADMQKALRDYGYNLGMAFQIADDVLDYQADANELGKSIGDDFKEGKMTSPVILALQNASEEEKKFWSRVFGSENITDADLKQAQGIIRKHGSDTKSLEMAKDYADQAVQSLDGLKESELKSLLIDTAYYALERKK